MWEDDEEEEKVEEEGGRERITMAQQREGKLWETKGGGKVLFCLG